MKAVVMHAYGAPDVLKYEDFPDPRAGAGEVLIKVVATSVNPFDIKVRSGQMKDFVPLTFPAILGYDVAGIVQELGSGTDGFSDGDKVFAQTSRAYATLCTAKATDLARIPEGMEPASAAALPTVTTTGAQLANLALSANPNGTVIVTGALGSVGRSAVYMAKRRGAKVIAGVLKRQVAEAKKVGADRVLALDDDNSINALEKLDAVADTVAGPVADQLIQKLKNGGVFATVLMPPSTASSYPAVHVEAMQVKPARATLLQMAQAVRDGQLTIPLGQRFALKDAAKAHAAVEKRSPGKTILLA